MSAKLLVPSGGPVHSSGGDVSAPSHVCASGIAPFGANAGELSSNCIVVPLRHSALSQDADRVQGTLSAAPENMIGRYHDRRDAGRQLAAALRAYGNRHDVIVLALPRGG